MYKIQHHSYCGMSDIPACFDTAQEATSYAAARIRSYRKSFHVVTLEPRHEWEILEPEDCAMVPDDCGTLVLRHITFECRECGCACETQVEALHCCAEYEYDGVEE